MSQAYEKALYNILKKIFEEKKEEFIPGKTKIHYAWAIYDHHEIFEALKSLLSGWLAVGKSAEKSNQTSHRRLLRGRSLTLKHLRIIFKPAIKKNDKQPHRTVEKGVLED